MRITCPVNGIIHSIDVPEKVAEMAQEKSAKTGKHVQTLLREASAPVIISGKEPTVDDFEKYLSKL